MNIFMVSFVLFHKKCLFDSIYRVRNVVVFFEMITHTYFFAAHTYRNICIKTAAKNREWKLVIDRV